MEERVERQRTIQREVSGGGIGLHSGAEVSLCLRPAPLDFGVCFRRIDMPGAPLVTAGYRYVTDTTFATSIGSNGVTVGTVEHLMAALLGQGIDNVLIEIDGPEVPVFDGSAGGFLDLIRQGGLQEQGAPRRYLKVRRPLSLCQDDAYIKVRPSEGFRLRYVIDFPHPLIGRQELSWSFSESGFAGEIARARTFGFLKDVQRLQSFGLAQGGSLSNAVVFDDYGLVNREGLRYDDECVRHKILDFLGDLALIGMPVLGDFEIYKAGHTLHNRFVGHLMAKPSFYAPSVPVCLTPPFFQAPAFSAFAEPVPLASKSV